jgi:hypothetical protein
MYSRIINGINQTYKGSLVPIDNYCLEGLIRLVENSRTFSTSIGVSATFDLSLWMNDFLIKHVDKISYVTTTPNFSIQSLENGFLTEKVVSVKSKTFNSDTELDEFFENQIGKKIVLYAIGKFINLSNMAISYELRYTDITLKSEQREIKLNKILK